MTTLLNYKLWQWVYTSNILSLFRVRALNSIIGCPCRSRSEGYRGLCLRHLDPKFCSWEFIWENYDQLWDLLRITFRDWELNIDNQDPIKATESPIWRLLSHFRRLGVLIRQIKVNFIDEGAIFDLQGCSLEILNPFKTSENQYKRGRTQLWLLRLTLGDWEKWKPVEET